MIHLITGAVNQGKSTHLLGIYRSLKKGDGFYNRKIYHGDCLAGQEIIHLATGESRLFAIKEGFIPGIWHEECRYDAFSFSREELEFGREIIQRALDSNIEPLFIDEIGPLELVGKGFNEILRRLLATSVDIYLVVRKSCLLNVINEFVITRYIEICKLTYI